MSLALRECVCVCVCVYRVYMQGYRQVNAPTSLVFLHQTQNEGAVLVRVGCAAVHLRQGEVVLRVLPEHTWNTHTHTHTRTHY